MWWLRLYDYAFFLAHYCFSLGKWQVIYALDFSPLYKIHQLPQIVSYLFPLLTVIAINKLNINESPIGTSAVCLIGKWVISKSCLKNLSYYIFEFISFCNFGYMSSLNKFVWLSYLDAFITPPPFKAMFTCLCLLSKILKFRKYEHGYSFYNGSTCLYCFWFDFLFCKQNIQLKVWALK